MCGGGGSAEARAPRARPARARGDLRRRLPRRAARARARREALAPDPGGWPWATFAANIAGAFAARLLRHAPAGAPAAVGLPAPVARHRALRRADDVLDHAARAAADARRAALALAVGYAAASLVGGLRGRCARDRARPPRRGDAHDALVWLGGRRARRGRRAGALPARRRRVAAGRPRSSRSARSRSTSAARSCSACSPARRSSGDALLLAGTGAARLVHDVLDLDARERTGSARTASSRLLALNLAVSLLRRPRRGRARARARGGAVNEDCLKLTIYFGERDRAGGRFLADALLDIYARHRLRRPACCMRGIEGFGVKHQLQHRPAAHAVRGPAARRGRRRHPRAHRGGARRGRGAARRRAGHARARPDAHRPRRRTSSCPSELARGDQADRLPRPPGARSTARPAYLAVVDLLHRRGVAGATVLLGVDGTAHGARQRARFFGRNAERAADGHRGRRRRRASPRVAARARRRCSTRPLMTLERVRVCKRDGVRLGRARQLPAPTPPGWRCGRS